MKELLYKWKRREWGREMKEGVYKKAVREMILGGV
jgi:hypothetical protein